MRKILRIIPLLLLCTTGSALAADTVLTWPPDGKDALLRFTISKLRQVNSTSGQTDLLGEALAENVSSKTIPSASFYLYLIDKNGKRVGERYLEVRNLPAGQKAKIPVTAHAVGSYATMQLQAQHLPSDEPMKIKMHINSVPPGATIKVDGQDAGVTPQVVPIAPGKHTIEFSKEGYATGSSPVDIAENAMPGSVDIDLKPLTADTVVLRDGTVLTGNLTSVTAATVNITVKGKALQVARSKVERIVLGQSRGAGNSGRKATKSSPR